MATGMVLQPLAEILILKRDLLPVRNSPNKQNFKIKHKSLNLKLYFVLHYPPLGSDSEGNRIEGWMCFRWISILRNRIKQYFGWIGFVRFYNKLPALLKIDLLWIARMILNIFFGCEYIDVQGNSPVFTPKNQKFLLRIDCKAAKHFLEKDVQNIASKQIFARWQAISSVFDFDIEFIKGNENSVPDFLTREFLQNR